MEKEKIILANLKKLLTNIVNTTEPRECYPLWKLINSKLAQYKNENIYEVYTACREEIELKMSTLKKQELLDLFYTIRLQSKGGTTNEHISFFENMSKKVPQDSCINAYMAVVYSNACWYSLKQKKYKESLDFGLKAATKVNLPKNKLNFVYVNLAHAYLANNQIDKAKEVYLTYGKIENYRPKECNYFNPKLPNGANTLNRQIMHDDLVELDSLKIFPESLRSQVAEMKGLLK